MNSKFIVGNDNDVTFYLDQLLETNDIVHMHFAHEKQTATGYKPDYYHVLVVYKERKENRLRLRKRRTVPEFEENGPDEKPYFSVDQKVIISSKENQGCLGKIGAAIVVNDGGVQYSVDVLFDRYGNEVLGTSMLINEDHLTAVDTGNDNPFGIFKGAKVLINPTAAIPYSNYRGEVLSWEDDESGGLIVLVCMKFDREFRHEMNRELWFNRSQLLLIPNYQHKY